MIGAAVSLVFLTGSLLALPLMPAFLELRLREDAGPIPIEDQRENIPDFAQSFQALFAQSDVGRRRASMRATTLVLEKDITLNDGIFFADPIYAKGSVCAGRGNVFRAILCDKDVYLGENNELLRWLHAAGKIVVRSRSEVYGRVSAGQEVQLGPFCTFERVHAPVIKIVGGAAEIAGMSQAQQTVLGRVTERMVVAKDFILPPGEFLKRNLVAGRRVLLQKGAHVIGSLKSNASMELEPNVCVEGSMVSASDLRIGQACFVQGPIMAEGEAVIESGTRIGNPSHPTTVRARRIRIASGVTIHGSLCAYHHGQVEG